MYSVWAASLKGVVFEFDAKDLDSDVCEPGDHDIYAYLRPLSATPPTLVVKGPASSSKNIPFALKQGKWTAEWKFEGVAGVYHFEFTGKLEDRYEDHPDSNDPDDLDVSGYKAAQALKRMLTHDSLSSWRGHGSTGTIVFYSVDEEVYDATHKSYITVNDAASPDPAITSVKVEDLQPNALKDVYIAVLIGCDTAEPEGHPEGNLCYELIKKGADITLGVPGSIHPSLTASWTSYFWPWVCKEEKIQGAWANIYNCTRFAGQQAVDDNPGLDQVDYDRIKNILIHLDSQVSSTECLWPARYGNSAN